MVFFYFHYDFGDMLLGDYDVIQYHVFFDIMATFIMMIKINCIAIIQ